MITTFNTAPTGSAKTTKGSGMGTIVFIGLLLVAGYFGYKEYKKHKENKEKQQ